MASLYELTAGYATLLDAYDAAETPEEQEEYLRLIANAEGDITDKADAYAKIMRMKQIEADGYKAEIDRLTARKRAAENVVSRLKSSMLDALKVTGEREVKTSIGKWRIQNNPWSADVEDWERVPMKYRTPQPDKVDKKSLVDDFKATGEIIPGVTFKQEMGIRFR